MATKEQIGQIMDCLEQWLEHPPLAQLVLNESQAGIGAAIKFLHQNQRAVTAGEIANEIHVSTARIAVLLKKMDARGLICREKSEQDRRVTLVRISDYGEQQVQECLSATARQIERMIDAIGMERLMQFIQTAFDIRTMMEKSGQDWEEDTL